MKLPAMFARLSIVRVLLMVPLALWLAACSLNYNTVSEETPDDVPSIALYDADFTVVRTTGSRLEVSAAKIEIFSSLNRQIFADASFLELDDDAEIMNRGTADHVTYFIDSGDVELKGSVEFYSNEQEATVFAENITWKDEERTLSSGLADRIEVIKESGDLLSGFGLHADMRRRTIELAEEVRGAIIVEDQAVAEPQTDTELATDIEPQADTSPEVADIEAEADTSPEAADIEAEADTSPEAADIEVETDITPAAADK